MGEDHQGQRRRAEVGANKLGGPSPPSIIQRVSSLERHKMVGSLRSANSHRP